MMTIDLNKGTVFIVAYNNTETRRIYGTGYTFDISKISIAIPVSYVQSFYDT